MTTLSISVPLSAKLFSGLFDAWHNGQLPEECQTVNVKCSDYSRLIVLEDMSFLAFVRKVGYGHIPQHILYELMQDIDITSEQIFGVYGGADLELTSEKYRAKNVTMISRFIVDRTEAIDEMNKYLNLTSRTGTSKKKRKAADVDLDTKKPAAEKKSSIAASLTAATASGGGSKSALKKKKGPKKMPPGEKKTPTAVAANAAGGTVAAVDASASCVFVGASSDVSTNGNVTTVDIDTSKKRKKKKDKKNAMAAKSEATSTSKPKVAKLTPPKAAIAIKSPNVGEAKSVATSIPMSANDIVRRKSLLKKKRRVISESSDEEEEEDTKPPSVSGKKHEREELNDLFDADEGEKKVYQIFYKNVAKKEGRK